MPSFVTNTGTEPEWQRAKEIVREEYPAIDEKSEQFWKLVTTIYKSIAHYQLKNESGNELLDAIAREDSEKLLDILRSPLSMSRNGNECKVYSKKVDGSRQLVFSGSSEDLKNFARDAELFAKTLHQLL